MTNWSPYYLVFGALQHAVLRIFGSHRLLRESCAMALYAAGGVGLIAQLFVIVIVLFVHHRYGVTDMLRIPPPMKWPFVIVTLAPYIFLYVTFGLALAGLHRAHGIASWHVVIANVLALAGTGFLFALLDPPGTYGLHIVVGPHFSSGEWHRVWSVTY